MKTYHWTDLDLIVKQLKSHHFVAVVETDTVMGVISLNSDLIYQVKLRPSEKKLVLFINDLNQIPGLSTKEINVLKHYVPGALTIIKNKVGYRIPNHENLLKLIALTGPIYSSSANISGQNPCVDINDATKIFKNQVDKIIFVEGKNLTNTPSTIIDLDQYKVLRNGVIDGLKILKELKQ